MRRSIPGSVKGGQTICYNTKPTIGFTEVEDDPVSGGSNLTYQWQSSPTNIDANYVDIAGAISKTYAETNALTATKYYRRKVTSDGGCGSVYSNYVRVTVYGEFKVGTIGSNQTICYGSSATALSYINSPTGGDGNYTYQWESSPTGLDGSFTSIAGQTQYDYAPGQLTENMHYRCKVTSVTNCGSGYSNVVTIKVHDLLTAGSITGNQDICYNIVPTAFTNNPATGGTDLEYQWQYNTDGSTYWFNNIAGANTQSYTPGALSTTTYYRRRVISGDDCGTMYTNTVKVNVYNDFIGGSITGDQTICYNAYPTEFTGTNATGGSGSISYQWEKSTVSETDGFSAIADAIAATYQETRLIQTTYYRRVETGGTCGTKYSNVVTVSVYPKIQAGVIAEDQTICYGAKPNPITNTSDASGGTGLKYQWEQSANATSGFAEISGATVSSYAPSVLFYTTYYRRKTTSSSSCGSGYSNVIAINVHQDLYPGSVKGGQTICYNTKPTIGFTEVEDDPVFGGSNLTYQWQSSPTNIDANYVDIAGAISKTYAETNALTATKYYRRKVTSDGGCGSVYSNYVRVTVYGEFKVGTIGSNQTICYGSSATALSYINSPTGGDGNYTYQWESSPTGLDGSFTSIAGQTQYDYAPGQLTENMHYRCKVTSVTNCGSGYSNVVTIKVHDLLTAGSITGNQDICYNIVPTAFTNNPATGGTDLEYQWQYNTDGSTSWFNNIAGANTQSYTPGALSTTTYYRRRVISGDDCGTMYTNTVKVNVYNDFIGGSITGDQTICYNAYPTEFTGTNATGGSGSISYQWEKSTVSETDGFSAIADAIAATYQETRLIQTTYYRRVETGGTCGTKYSNVVTVSVYPKIQAGVIAEDQTICYGAKPNPITNTSDASGGTGLKYQWEQSANATSGFAEISGATVSSYAPSVLYYTTYYRRKTTSSSSCGSGYSNVIAINVHQDLYPGSVKGGQTICYNTKPTIGFTEVEDDPVFGGSNLTYQWQSSPTNIDANYVDIAGAISKTYTELNALTTSTFYRRKVTSDGGCGSAYSNYVRVTVYGEFKVGTIGSNQTICYGSSATALSYINSPTGGDGNYTYQWESSPTGLDGSFTSIAGQTQYDYAPGQLTENMHYRCKVTSVTNCGSGYSNVVTIKVHDLLTAGSITGNQDICYNIVPTAFTNNPATGGTDLEYQWQYNTDGSTSWFNNIAGANTQSYTPGALSTTTYYRRRVISGDDCGTMYTNTVKVNVYNDFIGGSITGDQTICYNAYPTEFTGTNATGGSGSISYQWEKSTVSETDGFSAIADAIAATYQETRLIQTTYYRRVETGGTCGTKYSNVVTVSVYPKIQAGVIAEDQTICYGAKPNPITNTSDASGGTGLKYQWEQSANATSGFAEISGATVSSYAPSVLYYTTYYRRKTTSSSSCGSGYSNVIAINVHQDLYPGSVKGGQTICYNTKPTIGFTEVEDDPVSGGSNLTYQWQSSPTNIDANYVDIAGAISKTYTELNALTTSTFYRRKVTSDGGCGSAYSNVVKVTVYPQFIIGTIKSDQSICYNTSATTLSNNIPPSGGIGGFSYQWQVSTDGINFEDIYYGGTSDSYSPGTLEQTTYYRRKVTTGSACGSGYGNVVKITVYDPLAAGSIEGSQTICDNAFATMLSNKVLATGGERVNYQWQSNTTGNDADFVNITGVTAENHAPGRLMVTTYYRRKVTFGSCGGALYSNIIKVTVYPHFIGGSITGDQTICYGSRPAAFTSVDAVGGSGVTYQWLSSTDIDDNFQIIENATDATYHEPNNLIKTTYYKRMETSNCGASVTNILTVNVLSQLRPGSILGNQSICFGDRPALFGNEISAVGGINVAYQWEASTDNINFSAISGAITTTYAPDPLTQTTFYKRKVTSGNACGSLYSNVVTVTVFEELKPGLISGDQTICYNTKPIAFTSTTLASGGGNLSYQWQSSATNADDSFVDIFYNAMAETYTVPNALTGTRYYRRMATADYCGIVYSNVLKVTVYGNLVSSTIAGSQSICHGATASPLTTQINPIGGTGVYTYQWESSPTMVDADFTPIASNGTNMSFNPEAPSQTTYYRCKVTSSICGTVTSNIVYVEVYADVIAGEIGADQAICYNTAPARINNKVDASGGNENLIMYQWQSNTTGNDADFVDIAGAMGLSYTPSQLIVKTYYRRKATFGVCGVRYSNVVTITVYQQFTTGSIASDQTIVYGSTPEPFTTVDPASGGTDLVYQWEYSHTNIPTDFVAVDNGTSETYAPGELIETTYYRRKVTASCGISSCGSGYSNVLTVTVYGNLTPGMISSNQKICHNSQPAPFTATGPTGCTGVYEYAWESSTDNATFTAITLNGTSATYTEPNKLVMTTYYRRKVTSGACGNDYSNVVKVTVYHLPSDYPDIRVQMCAMSARPVHLSSFLDTTDFNTVNWARITANSPDISADGKGTILTGNIDKTGVHVYSYTIANSCYPTEKTRKLYLLPLANKLRAPLVDTVVICKDQAEGINLRQILGLEAGGTWSYHADIDPCVKKVTTQPFTDALILDGKAALINPNLQSATYRKKYKTDLQALYLEFTYTTPSAPESCLDNQAKRLVIVITSVFP